MRRVLRVLGVAALVAAGVVVAWPTGADAELPEAYGWWFRPEHKAVLLPEAGGVPITAPQSPTVPDEGLYVANDPSGPLAISALRFSTLTGSGEFLLVAKVAPNNTASGATVLACPALGTWDANQNGKWEDRPQDDCRNRKVNGTVDAGGRTMSFVIPPSFLASPDATELDIALVPSGPVPFQVAFDPPLSEDVGKWSGPPKEQDLGPEVAPEGSPAAEPSTATGATGDSGATAGSSAGTTFDSSTALPPDVPTASEAAVEATNTPLGGGGGGTESALAVPATPAAESDGAERTISVLLLLMIGAGLYWLSTRQGRRPALVAAAAGAPPEAAGSVGGIGRFARPRAIAPQRL